jgi:hypothetical protein
VIAQPPRPEPAASPLVADLPRAPEIVDELPAPVRPQSFRETTSCSIALSAEVSDQPLQLGALLL